ncbi:MAG TPA: aminoglycoside phosphotransferase family protein [Bryobacteraceae bacterium]|nr:aminoglycoside phosphotransferase family protein [Bryobacteraceae bacterium]
MGYLLGRELLGRAAIVDGDLRIVEASRRNRNFKVMGEPDRSYLLKQGLDADARATVAYEAAVYRFLEDFPDAGDFRCHVPRYVDYDAQEGILILELLNDSQDFREYHTRQGHFSITLAAALGSCLSKLHRSAAAALPRVRESGLARPKPWVLSLHQPGLDVFRRTSNANLHLIRTVQQTAEISRVLAELRESWRVDSLIHNDIKWDNCLVRAPSTLRHKFEFKLIDWEFATVGDSAWDAGSVFSSYLSFWLSSVPVSGGEPPDRFLELARYPLERMQPAIRAYWRNYVLGMGFGEAEAQERLFRAVRYAAARLVQTAFEQLQYSTNLTGNAICLLQLSANIMQRPREAIAHLLGISLQAEGRQHYERVS